MPCAWFVVLLMLARILTMSCSCRRWRWPAYVSTRFGSSQHSRWLWRIRPTLHPAAHGAWLRSVEDNPAAHLTVQWLACTVACACAVAVRMKDDAYMLVYIGAFVCCDAVACVAPLFGRCCTHTHVHERVLIAWSSKLAIDLHVTIEKHSCLLVADSTESRPRGSLLVH